MKITLNNDRPVKIEADTAAGHWVVEPDKNELTVVRKPDVGDWQAGPVVLPGGMLSPLSLEMVGAVCDQTGMASWRVMEEILDAVGLGSYSRKVAGARMASHGLLEEADPEYAVDPALLAASLDAMNEWNENEPGDTDRPYVHMRQDGGVWTF